MKPSRIVAAGLALAVVAIVAWSLFQPYLIGRFARGDCADCGWGPYFEVPDGWVELNAGPFRLRAPEGSQLLPQDGPMVAAGRIVHPALAITYYFGPHANDLGWMRKAQDYTESPIWIDDHWYVIRSASFPGRPEPYVISLYIEQAAQVAGTNLSLEIHGSFATPDRLFMAQRILETVKFGKLPARFLPQAASSADSI